MSCVRSCGNEGKLSGESAGLYNSNDGHVRVMERLFCRKGLQVLAWNVRCDAGDNGSVEKDAALEEEYFKWW